MTLLLRGLLCFGSLLTGGTGLAATPEPAGSEAAAPDLGGGNGVLALCSSEREADRQACLAYLQGYIIGASSAAMRSGVPLTFCAGLASVEEIRGRVVARLEANVWHRDNAAAILVLESLEQAFPCPGPQPPPAD